MATEGLTPGLTAKIDDRGRRHAGGQAHGRRRRSVDTSDDRPDGTRGYPGRAAPSPRGAYDGRLRGQRQALRRHAQGPEVTVRAELLEVDGRKLRFKVEAHDENKKVGEGTHRRAIIQVQKKD